MPFKKIKRAFKKITKPVAKVLDKVVPNEIKPFLPYAAAFVPFAAPASFGIGSLSPMVSRAFYYPVALTWQLNYHKREVKVIFPDYQHY